MEEAWNEELNAGGMAAQWVTDFESELARLEAELDGVRITPKLLQVAIESRDVIVM